MSAESSRAGTHIGVRVLSILVAATLAVFAGVCMLACGEARTPLASKSEMSAVPTEEPPDVIRIGAVIPVTGEYSGQGVQIRNGYELAVESINADGGVDIGGTRVPIELMVLDDGSDPATTVEHLETLDSAGVVAYLGGAGNYLHAVAAETAERNETPYLGVGFFLVSVHEQGSRYLFSPYPKSDDHARTTFDLLDSLKPIPSTVAILQENTDWGEEMAGMWEAEAEARGGYTVNTYEYESGTSSFSSVLLAARVSGAEVILALPTPVDGLALMTQIKELGFDASVYLFIRASDPPTFGTELGKYSDGVLLMPGWNSQLPHEGVVEMVQRYGEEYGSPAGELTGPAYACVQILVDAIGRAGSVDRETIRDALAETDLETVVGRVRFAEDGTWVDANDPVSQWQGGQQVLVFPEEIGLAPIVYPAVPWVDR